MCYNIDTNSRAREVSMSIVRYTNKKTGWVSVYESTSNYDPVTKKSRPKRRYIGYEDPVTGDFVKSSGKPGRKKKVKDSAVPEKKQSASGGGGAMTEVARLREEIRELRKQNMELNKKLEDIHGAVESFVSEIQKTY